MYSSWRCSAGVVKATAPAPSTSQTTKPTLQVPESLMKSLAGKWHLPKELIIISHSSSRGRSSVNVGVAKKAGKSATYATTEAAAPPVTIARGKLSRGFELLFHLLASGRSASVLSRRQLATAASQLSTALQLGDRHHRQLQHLLDDFWGLMDELTVGQMLWRRRRRDIDADDDNDDDRAVSLADVLDGVRTRVRTGRDLMELRRRLLQLAGGLFAVVSAASAEGDGGSAATTKTATFWTAQLLDALAVAVGAERAAEVRAALLATKGQRATTAGFGELHREAWLRLVHEQFF